MREVDTYIDTLRAENDLLRRVSRELNLLWLHELDSQKEFAANQQEASGVAWGRVCTLLEESAEHLRRGAEGAEQTLLMAEQAHSEQKVRWRLSSFLFGALFYLGLALIVVSAFFLSGARSVGPPQNVMGYSAMTVLTGSMQRELPQDSLIVTRQVAPETIRIGDDITYLMRTNVTVTHRVVGIYPNHENSGMIGFETQGIENPTPDAEIVLAANVVGRVVFHSLLIGSAILFIQSHLLYVGIFTALSIAFVITLRKVFSKEPQR